MACTVYFHLFLPGNTGLYICACVLWRVGCADITESLCDLILVTSYIFVQLEMRIEINIWFNLPVHVLFFTLPVTHNRRAILAICQSSSKEEGGKYALFYFIFKKNNNIIIINWLYKRSVLIFLNLESMGHSACESLEPASESERSGSSVVPRVWFVRHMKCGGCLPFSFLYFWQGGSKMRTWLSHERVICSCAVSAGCWIFHTGPSLRNVCNLEEAAAASL